MLRELRPHEVDEIQCGCILQAVEGGEEYRIEQRTGAHVDVPLPAAADRLADRAAFVEVAAEGGGGDVDGVADLIAKLVREDPGDEVQRVPRLPRLTLTWSLNSRTVRGATAPCPGRATPTTMGGALATAFAAAFGTAAGDGAALVEPLGRDAPVSLAPLRPTLLCSAAARPTLALAEEDDADAGPTPAAADEDDAVRPRCCGCWPAEAGATGAPLASSPAGSGKSRVVLSTKIPEALRHQPLLMPMQAKISKYTVRLPAHSLLAMSQEPQRPSLTRAPLNNHNSWLLQSSQMKILRSPPSPPMSEDPSSRQRSSKVAPPSMNGAHATDTPSHPEEFRNHGSSIWVRTAAL